MTVDYNIKRKLTKTLQAKLQETDCSQFPYQEILILWFLLRQLRNHEELCWMPLLADWIAKRLRMQTMWQLWNNFIIRLPSQSYSREPYSFSWLAERGKEELQVELQWADALSLVFNLINWCLLKYSQLTWLISLSIMLLLPLFSWKNGILYSMAASKNNSNQPVMCCLQQALHGKMRNRFCGGQSSQAFYFSSFLPL